ncbi:MAG: divergent polysaccharide deacetylase family protein [Rhodospirillales bacterium]
MAPAGQATGRHRPRTPLALLALFLLTVAAVAVWAAIAGPPDRTKGRSAVTVAVTRPGAAPPAPAPASLPASPPGEAQPPSPAAAAPPAPQAAPAPAAASETAPTPPGGRRPWQAYAQPFNAGDTRPRTAIVVTGLGLNVALSEQAIRDLPPGVTLSFSPYADNLARWIEAARNAGHEALLDLPMEPLEYPHRDPGPHTLLTGVPPDQNLERLRWALGRATGYVGVIDTRGSRFVASARDLLPVLTALGERGLLFVDAGSAATSTVPTVAPRLNLPWTASVRTIDERLSKAMIDDSLNELEQTARSVGRAVGTASLLPLAVQRIASWAGGLDGRGIALAPVTAALRGGPSGSNG